MEINLRMPGRLTELLDQVVAFKPGTRIYIVGGTLRDYLLTKKFSTHDLDTATNADVAELAPYLGKYFKVVPTGIKFGIITVFVGDIPVDIGQFRFETYKRLDRHPEVRRASTIEEDLSRRDFTINAMALEYTRGRMYLIDPFGGMQDLQAGVVRAVGAPEERFDEDPERMMRAVRLAKRLGFTIEENTLRAIQRLNPL